MSRQTMLPTALALLACALAGFAIYENAVLREQLGVAVGEGAGRPALHAELEQLESSVESRVHQVVEAELAQVRAAQAESGAPPAQKLAQGLADLEQMAIRLDAVEETVAEVGVSPVAIGDQILRGRMPSGETVAEFLDRRLEERALGGRGLDGAQALDRKPSFDQLAAALALDETQRVDVQQTLDLAKDRCFELLSTPRMDGGSFVDDMTELFLSLGEEKAGEQMGPLFMRIFSEPYPGGTGTYGSMLVGLQGETSQSIRDVLEPEQKKVFGSLELDLLEIDTGRNPFEEHIVRAAETRER